MTSQLGAIAATVSLIVLLILFVVMSINMTYKIAMKEWQGLAIFWSSLLAFVFLALYVLMSWPESSDEPDYYYVPVDETLYRMVRTKSGTLKALQPDTTKSQELDSVYHMSISDTLTSISNYGHRN